MEVCHDEAVLVQVSPVLHKTLIVYTIVLVEIKRAKKAAHREYGDC